MRRAKGRGAREQHRAERRAGYSALVLPYLIERLEPLDAAERVLLLGDGLVELAGQLAPQVSAVALVEVAFEQWNAAQQTLSDHTNVQVIQELAELDDPDGFPVEPWTVGIMLLPYHLGTREMNSTLEEFTSHLINGAPMYVGGSRTHEWDLAQERLGALISPLTTLYNRDPVRIIRGTVAHNINNIRHYKQQRA